MDQLKYESIFYVLALSLISFVILAVLWLVLATN